MSRPMPDPVLASSYYPPRAGWRAGLVRPLQGPVRRFEALVRRLPGWHPAIREALCLGVPGVSFYLSGWRKVGVGVCAGWVAALAAYVFFLGYPAANLAFMALIMAHTASVSQRFQPWPLQHRLATQVGLGVLLFLGVSGLVYAPARQGFERSVATPLPASVGIVIVNPRAALASVQRGDWLAYRIASTYAGGIAVRSGFGFGPVLAVPGDRVTFAEDSCHVNDTRQPRHPYMPQSGGLTVGPRQWFVWPEVEVNAYGGSAGAVAEALLGVALVSEPDVAGRPYRRWFFRKQTIP